MTALISVKAKRPGEISFLKEVEDLRMTMCPLCEQDGCDIWMRGYGCDIESKETHDVLLCRDCATQLARKILEDICEFTKGGRNG